MMFWICSVFVEIDSAVGVYLALIIRKFLIEEFFEFLLQESIFTVLHMIFQQFMSIAW